MSSDKNLGKYELFATLENGSKVKVAEVKNGEKTILNVELYDNLRLEKPGLIEAKIKASKITPELIDAFTKHMTEDRAIVVRGVLEKWLGKTWEEAVNAHSLAKPNPK